MPPPEIVLYTAPGCCLCEDLKAQLSALKAEIPFALREVNIEGDAELEARFRTEIPVLFVNGRKVAKYRITIEALRRSILAR